MTDLRISFYFQYKDGDPTAPDGPGWYIAAYRQNEQGRPCEIVPRVRIPSDEMIKIGKVLDKFIDGKPLNWTLDPNYLREDIALEDAIAEEVENAKEYIKAEVILARAQASRLANLERRAAEFGIELDE